MLHLRCLSGAMLALLGVVLFLAPSGERVTAAAELAEQKDRQKQVQAETDRLVRRIETMIRVMEYNRLDQTAQKQLFDEVGKTLAGLSKEQMTAVLTALEKASKTTGNERDGELKKAQEQHVQIVLTLKG